MDVTPLVELCKEAVREGCFPGASFAIGTRETVAFGQAGRLGPDPGWPKVREDTIYDVASLTKVVATTMAAMIACEQGLLDLDDRVAERLPGFAGPKKDRVTVRHLLLHTSGLAAYGRYEHLGGDPGQVLMAIQSEPLEAPPGERTLYSCLNAVLLQLCVEESVGMSLDRFVQERVFAPLGMHDTRFRPAPALTGRIAPTTRAEAWRRRAWPDGPEEGEWLRGQVHDPIAFLLGGVSGNAGLFSTAGDLARFAWAMLRLGELDGARIALPATVLAWTRRAEAGSTRALGWDTRSEEGSSAGTRFGARSYGHTGFTGTSLWIDPDRGGFAVLLTNRVCPDPENAAIAAFRPRFHDLAALLIAPVATPFKTATPPYL